MFRTVPLSIIRSFSLYTQQWFVSHSLLTAHKQDQNGSVLTLLANCQQKCVTYIIAVWTVKNSWWWTEELSKTCRVFTSVINKLDAQYCCFTVSLFHASTCFEHMCSKHVEAWNKLTVKQKFCASSWLITDINILRCMVSKTSSWLINEISVLRCTVSETWSWLITEISVLRWTVSETSSWLITEINLLRCTVRKTSSWLITEIKLLRCTVSKTSRKINVCPEMNSVRDWRKINFRNK
jgi:hypothetical protein